MALEPLLRETRGNGEVVARFMYMVVRDGLVHAALEIAKASEAISNKVYVDSLPYTSHYASLVEL